MPTLDRPGEGDVTVTLADTPGSISVFGREADIDATISIAIGDHISSSDPETLLHTNSSGNLADSLVQVDTDNLLGLIPVTYLTADDYSTPRISWLDLSGVAVPNALAVSMSGTGSFFVFDRVNVSSKLAVFIDTSTPANDYFEFNMAGVGGAGPYIRISNSAIAFDGADINVGSNKITNVTDPTADQHAATKKYVDDGLAGLSFDIDDLLPTQSGHSGEFLTTDGSNASWDSVSATPGGSDTEIQWNNSGVFDGFGTYLSAYDVMRLTGGGQCASGHSQYGWGDTDGNMKVTGQDNAMRLYGYTYIELADGTGKYGEITRSRISHGTESINTTPIGGGNLDYGLQFGERVSAYGGKGIGAGYVPRVDATANNDLLIGSYFTPNLQHGSYTGVVKVGSYFINLNADAIAARFQAASSQTANMLEFVNSSIAVQLAIAANGRDFILDTATGTKIGTATSQKLGFFNATPIIQYTTTGTTTGFTANSSANFVFNESVFTGNTGSTAYTVSDIVRALKLLGLIAA